MKHWLFICTFAFVSLLTISASNPKDAISYNDFIVSEQNKIGKLTTEFSKACEKGQLNKMQEKHTNLSAQIAESIRLVSGLPAWRGNTAFRDASVKLFELYRSITANEYIQMMAIFNEGIDMPGNRSKLSVLFDSINRRSKEVTDRFLDEQKKFAETFKIKLTENSYEKELKDQKPSPSGSSTTVPAKK